MPEFMSVKHPCTWIFLDDEARFLDAIRQFLPEDQPVLMFSDPFEVVRLFDKQEDRELDWRMPRQLRDLQNVEELLCDTQRFQIPAVLVVDYSMPGVDGLTVCKNLDDSRIRTILLTGVADETTAADAFNKGIIDRYIKKGDQNALSKIVEFATELTEEVLCDNYPATALEGPVRSVLRAVLHSTEFKNFLSSRDIVEYYYWEEPFGVLGLDWHGKGSFFVIEISGERFERSDNGNIKEKSGLFESGIYISAEGSNEFNDEFTPVVLQPIVGTDILFGVLENPPLSVDYIPSKHSLAAYLQGSG